MTDDGLTPGGHQLPASFAQPAFKAGRTPRKKPTRLILTGLGVVVVAGLLGGVHLLANLGFDDARTKFASAAREAADDQDGLVTSTSSLQSLTATASVVVDNDSRVLLDATAHDSLAAAIADAQDAASEAQSAAEQGIPDAGAKPFWTWELFGATAELNDNSALAQRQAETFAEVSENVDSAATVVDDAGTTALVSAADAAAGFEAAHVSARNLDIIALRDAAEDVQYYSTSLDDSAATAYADLEAAAAQMLASEQEELAEKAGPLQGSRIEAEAFARSLAPGVLLDFDWAPLVNGFGENGSMGGYATWWYSDPGYSTILFSNSVAEEWPNDRSKALIAHEVGHSISVRCDGMYDDSTQENIEAWATAWAISMGFHDDANGTWAYGAPPQSLIDAAAGCR